MSNSPLATAVGSGLAVGGGLIAQAPNTNVGTVGAIVAIGGLATAILGGLGQIIKVVVDARAYDAKLSKLEEDLAASRKRRHEDANRFQAMWYELKAQQAEAEAKAAAADRKASEAAIRAARLEGRFGQADKIHGEAINANSDNINALADKTGTDLPSQPPHVTPSPPLPVFPILGDDSGDEFPTTATTEAKA